MDATESAAVAASGVALARAFFSGGSTAAANAPAWVAPWPAPASAAT